MSKPSPEALIDQTAGPFLEVGGPTQHLFGEPVVNFEEIEKPLIVSNVIPPYVREGYWVNRFYRVAHISSFHNTERPTGLRGKLHKFWGEGVKQEDTVPVEQHLDLYADATALPVASGKVGALYASALQPEVETPFLKEEAPRVLEPGGILVIENAKKTVVDGDVAEYFDVLKRKKVGKQVVSLVLQRNETSYVPQEGEPV